MFKSWVHNGVTVFQGRVSLFGTGSLKTFAFLWDGNLVDTGPGSLERQFMSAFRSSRIERVLLTHFHEDHSGNAARLQLEKSVPVMANSLSVDLLKRDARLPLYRRCIWGKRPKFNPVPIDTVVESENGRLEVIGAPGHSHDHICLLNSEQGALFTGDILVTPHPKTILRYESIPEIIRSLRKLLQKDFETVYCAHAGVVEKGRDLLKKKLDYLEQLREDVLALHRRGISDREIDKKIFRRQALTIISSGEWSSLHMVRSIINSD